MKGKSGKTYLCNTIWYNSRVFLSLKQKFSQFVVKNYFARRKNPVLKEVMISWLEIS